jgi:hypothetical protein
MDIRNACQIVTQHYYGNRGVWAYQAFEWINDSLFFGKLPYPLVLLGLTSHGACLGWSMSPAGKGKPPTILLHPSLWAGTEKEDPWQIPPDLLGPRYALDGRVLTQLPGVDRGSKSHRADSWLR